MDNKQILPLLKKTPLFAETSDASLNGLLKSAVQKTSAPGEKIVEEGKGGVGFYLILEGQAKVLRDGNEVAQLETGNFFGELSVIDGAPRTADVVAETETSCLVITPWAMKSIISTHPEVALSMLQELARRLRGGDDA